MFAWFFRFFYASLALFVFSLGVSAQAPAPQDPAIENVQRFYQATKDLSAAFEQTYFYKVYSRTERSTGTVSFKKAGKMRWDYALPNGKVIVCNGRSLLIYEPSDDGSAGQYVEQSVQNSELLSSMSFLVGSANLSRDYLAKRVQASDAKQFDVLELQPKTPHPSYHHMIIYVDRDPRVLGLVRRVILVDAAGNRNRFDFKDIKFNRGLSDAIFNWKPPVNSRRIR